MRVLCLSAVPLSGREVAHRGSGAPWLSERRGVGLDFAHGFPVVEFLSTRRAFIEFQVWDLIGLAFKSVHPVPSNSSYAVAATRGASCDF